MALDMRMIDPHYEDHPDNKASHCAKIIAEYYQKYDAQKGLSLIHILKSPASWARQRERKDISKEAAMP